MVLRRLRLPAPAPATTVPYQRLREAFASIRADLGVPAAFPDDVLAEVDAAVRQPPSAPVDLLDVPFVTVDPPGSTDLDQALHLALDGDGLLLHYAIADVPGWVREGTALARETWKRGQTLYAPDEKVPLHPPAMSDGAASLLADRERTAIVWRIRLDARGEQRGLDVLHARVRSRARLDYAHVQGLADAHPLPGGAAGAAQGTDPTRDDVLPAGPLPQTLDAEQAVLLRACGLLRLAAERRRGGASLPLPSQEVEVDGDRYRLVLRASLPAEDWNAQLSLLTGMAAAQVMLQAGVGVLRTLPVPDPEPIERFRRQAAALGVEWAPDVAYGAFLRTLDPTRDTHLALLHEAAALFRGAAYTPFDGAVPDVHVHAAVAAPYAHVTAPLRRLVDRFGLAVCLAVTAGQEVPAEIRAALPRLPSAMSASDHLASQLERRCLDVVEAAVLAPAVGGPTLPAVVVQADGRTGQVQLLDPPVLARCPGDLRLGERIDVRVVAADLAKGSITLERA